LWNPHAHQVATDGVLGPDGSFDRISITRREHLAQIEEAFRREILGILQARDLLTEDDIEGMLAWPHSGRPAHRFGVHNEVKVLPGDRDGVIDLRGRPSASTCPAHPSLSSACPMTVNSSECVRAALRCGDPTGRPASHS